MYYPICHPSFVSSCLVGIGLVMGASHACDANPAIGKDLGEPQAKIVVSDRELHRMLLVTDEFDQDLKPKFLFVRSNGKMFLGRLEEIAKSSGNGAEITAICSIYNQAKGNKTVPLRSVREIIRQHPRKQWSDKANELALGAATEALGYLGEAADAAIIWRILREERKLVLWPRDNWDSGLLFALGQLGESDCQEQLTRWVEEQSRGLTESEVKKDDLFKSAYRAIGTIQYRRFLKGLPKP